MYTKFTFFLLACMCLFAGACSSDNQYEDSSVYVTINDWTHKFPPNATHTVPMTIMASGKKGWEGTVKVMVKKGEDILNETEGTIKVARESEEKLSLDIQLPEEEGTYEIVAEITGHQGQPVKNRRLIEIDKPFEF